MADSFERLIALSAPGSAEGLNQLRGYVTGHLWHEFTEAAIVSVGWLSAEGRTLLWEKLVFPNIDKLNPLRSARLAVLCKPDANAVQFLSKVAEKLKSSQQAHVILKAEESSELLKENNAKEAKKILLQCKEFITSHESQDLDADTHSTYYRCLARFEQSAGEYTEFYKSSLQYLIYVDLNELSLETKRDLAYDIAVAALVGDKLFNFGELLNHPILQSLQDTPHVWLLQIVRAMNSGSLEEYQKITNSNGSAMQQITPLKQRSAFLTVKARLMALMYHLFIKPEQQRVITFTEAAKVMQCNVDDVERLLLKALSLGLVKGLIDQVGQVCNVTWVQARVLSRDEIQQTSDRVKKWHDKVKQQLSDVKLQWEQLDTEKD